MARMAQIVSTAWYLPERAVTKTELTERFTAFGRPTVIDGLQVVSGTKRQLATKSPQASRQRP